MTSVDKDVEEIGETEMVQSPWKTAPWEWNLELPHDPAMPLLCVYPEEMETGVSTILYVSIHNSTFNNNNKPKCPSPFGTVG